MIHTFKYIETNYYYNYNRVNFEKHKRLKLKLVPGGHRIREVAVLEASHSPSTLSISTISPLFQPYLTDPPLHLTFSTRAFLPFLFSYFPLLRIRLDFPSVT